MPERELPEHLASRLSEELTSGAPLRAPLASQARYATAAAAPSGRAHVGARRVRSGHPALALVAATLLGAPQPRQWLIQSVGNLGGVTFSPSPSPAHQFQEPHPTEPVESPASPEPSETPETHESPEPSQSPEPGESPQPSSSPESDGGDHPTTSPSPGTSD
jgi:hypothetical protein